MTRRVLLIAYLACCLAGCPQSTPPPTGTTRPTHTTSGDQSPSSSHRDTDGRTQSSQPAPPFVVREIKPSSAYDVTRLKLPDNHGGLWSLAWAPDSSWLAGGTGMMSMTYKATTHSKGGDILVWDLTTGERRTLASHGATVDRLLVTPDGETLISVSRKNGVIKVWEVSSNTLRGELFFEASSITAPTGWPLVRLSADGSLLAVVTKQDVKSKTRDYVCGGDLIVWNTASLDKVVHWRNTCINELAVSSKADRIVAIVAETAEHERNGETTLVSLTHLTAWRLDSEKPYHAERHNNSHKLVIDSREAVVKSIEQPNLQRLLVTYDLETFEKLDATEVFPERRVGSESLFVDQAGRIVYSNWMGLEAVDPGSAETLFRVEFDKPVLRSFENNLSPNRAFLVPTNDLDYVYVLRLRA